ncbi:MAG: efflux RND transporter periplasmic adaptor subunit [Bdellovibrionales bacterium]|nr:efflux RND transporter periplasmic adaptor subunit [Bdellovibrionales bacterium]
MKKYSIKVFLFLTLLFSQLLIWTSCEKSNDEIVFENIPVERVDLLRTFEASGAIEYKNLVEARAPTAGRLEKLYAKEGDFVKKNQVLATMSSNKRIELLDAARSAGKEEKDFWEKQLLPTKIFSPSNGEVYDRRFSEQDYVSGWVMRISTGKVVRVNVDEVDLNKVYVGQEVTLFLDIASEKKVLTKVQKISQTSRKVSNVNVYEVEIPLLDEHQNYFGFVPRYGMSVTVEFPIEQYPQALALPLRAVGSQFSKELELTKSSGEKVRVELGNIFGEYVYVKSGLSEGDAIQIEKFSASGSVRKESPLLRLIK